MPSPLSELARLPPLPTMRERGRQAFRLSSGCVREREEHVVYLELAVIPRRRRAQAGDASRHPYSCFFAAEDGAGMFLTAG